MTWPAENWMPPTIARKILSSESWIVRDGAGTNTDANGVCKRTTRCLRQNGHDIRKNARTRTQHRQHACDNRAVGRWASSSASITTADQETAARMGRPSNDGGPDAVTRTKPAGQPGRKLQPVEVDPATPFTEKITLTQATPTICIITLEVYSQLAGGRTKSSACHCQDGNDLTGSGPGLRHEQYKLSSYNRTKRNSSKILRRRCRRNFLRQGHSSSTIQDGKYYNNEFRPRTFGRRFKDGQNYQARIVTKDISRDNGSDLNRREEITKLATVTNGQLTKTRCPP